MAVNTPSPQPHTAPANAPVEVGNTLMDTTHAAPVNYLVPLPPKKNEALAFVLPFFFSVLGVFYSDTKKAGNLLAVIIGLNILNLVLFYDDSDTWWSVALFLTFAFWITSIIVSVNAVSRYNDSIARKQMGISEVDTDTGDVVANLFMLIQREKGKSALEPSDRTTISNILVDYCTTEEQARYIIAEYQKRYNMDIVKELSKLSTSYQQIKESLSVFIHFGIVNPNFPHNYTV